MAKRSCFSDRNLILSVFKMIKIELKNRKFLPKMTKNTFKSGFHTLKCQKLRNFKDFTNFQITVFQNQSERSSKKHSKVRILALFEKKFVQNHFLDLSRKFFQTLQNPSFKLRKWDSGRFGCFQTSKSRFRTSCLDLTQS